MAEQIIPIQGLADIGLVADLPAVSLPPNVFTDALNVRFRDGAVRKMEGEETLTLPGSALTNLQYIAYWQGPQTSYLIAVDNNVGNTLATLYAWPIDSAGDLGTRILAGTMTTVADAQWQHTLFNGGFNIVINNGVTTPQYLTDPVAASTSTALPNWDSYLTQEDVVNITWDQFNADIPLARNLITLSATTTTLLYTVIPRDASEGILNYTATATDSANNPFTLNNNSDDTSEVTLTPRARTDSLSGALPGDTIIISLRTIPAITVTAGVVRSYGNLLVAGDLTETDATDGTTIRRRMPGTIRTSDVAAPGVVPSNWNPFRNGANTADEFILSSTGKVQDLAELQGVLYVYTDNSIHSIQQTGNPNIPFQISPVTDTYGANGVGSVLEFDGQHIVVGSEDVYMFSGHPGSIKSIADGVVRDEIYDATAPDANKLRIYRNQRLDEIWFYEYGAADQSLIYVWNYRANNWTNRSMSSLRALTEMPKGTRRLPLAANSSVVFFCDVVGDYSDEAGESYESYVERQRLALTPEFDTETLGAMAIHARSTDDTALTLTIRATGTNAPGAPSSNFSNNTHDIADFTVLTDYKVDTRVQGRFLNYRITDVDQSTTGWIMPAYQFEIMKGGKR